LRDRKFNAMNKSFVGTDAFGMENIFEQMRRYKGK
jgi:hypothetical protein